MSRLNPTTAPSSSNDSSLDLVGPISEKYCYYFYILSAISIVYFVVVFFAIIYVAFKQQMKPWQIFLLFVYSSQLLLFYLQNRLLYNMCIHSVV